MHLMKHINIKDLAVVTSSQVYMKHLIKTACHICEILLGKNA